MTIGELMEDRYMEGKEEGREESKIEIAKKMKEDGMDKEKISDLTGLSIEEIENL